MQKVPRFPSRLELRAVELGADELINLAEWKFRHRPRALRNLRNDHRHYLARLLHKIERAS